MNSHRLLAVALAAVVVLSALAPFGAVASEPDDDDLSLVVSSDRTVTVTSNDSAVENATVTVTDDAETYAGTGNYSTDANGTVDLPEPDEPVSVTVTASTTAETVALETDLEPADAPDDLAVAVDQDDDVVATVTDDGDALANATLEVTADDAYDETGEYETDENGTVTLESPTETIDVTFEATVGGVTETTTKTLEGDVLEDLSIDVSQNETVTATVTDDGDALANASVNVTTDDNDTYAETGSYETDENGTVSLATPTETLEVTFEATVGNVSATTTETLEGETDDEDDSSGTFGSIVSSFVQSVQTDGPPGQSIAEFVTGNNPGNAPDHAGPSNESNSSDESNDTDRQGPPEHAGPSADGNESADESSDENQQGPPDHAGQSDTDDESDDGEPGPPDHAGSNADSGSDDSGGGPPDHAGP